MKFPPLALAQVETEHPNEFKVSVIFPHLGVLTAVRVRVAADHATGTSGRFCLPQQGQWGIVEFYQDDPGTGIWTWSIPDRRLHAAPLELLSEDPRAIVDYLPGGVQVIHRSNGDYEMAFPDGSLFKLARENPRKRTPRKRSVRDGTGTRREDYTPPKQAPAHLHFHRATPAGGLDLDVTPEGEFTLALDQGGQDMYRVNASSAGKVTLENQAGATLTLDAAGGAKLSTRAGASVTISAAGSITINAAPGLPMSVQGTGAPIATVGSLVGPGPKGLMVLTGNPLLLTTPPPV